MKFFVTLERRTWEVQLEGNRVVLDGVEHHAELRRVAGTPLRLLMLDGQTRALPMESLGRGGWSIQAQGERCELEVLDERAAHLRTLLGAAAPAAGPAILKAPMPGLVIRVLAQPGQQVAAGASLIVLEAMKMENELKAASAGVVDSVQVAPGQTVEKGEILLRFARPSA